MITNEILQVIGTIAGALFVYLLTHIIRKIRNESLRDGLLDALAAGVAETQDSFVVWAKAAAADGKLTKEDRQKALQLTLETAIKISKNSRITTALQKLTMEEINAFVKGILSNYPGFSS